MFSKGYYLDDIRPIDIDFDKQYAKFIIKCTSVNELIANVQNDIQNNITNIFFDLDHDLGNYANDGGDAIKFIDWLIENHRNIKDFGFHFHSANPVGVNNMRNAIGKYWTEV